MSKFTPGPWVIVPEKDDDDFWQFYINPKDLEPFNMAMSVAKCYRPENARLIAAAPDMYEALLKCEDFIINSNFEPKGELLDIVQDALYKAQRKGESHD